MKVKVKEGPGYTLNPIYKSDKMKVKVKLWREYSINPKQFIFWGSNKGQDQRWEREFEWRSRLKMGGDILEI